MSALKLMNSEAMYYRLQASYARLSRQRTKIIAMIDELDSLSIYEINTSRYLVLRNAILKKLTFIDKMMAITAKKICRPSIQRYE